MIAGGCYGLAGAFISAQTGSGDPLVGNPMLLQIFAAVVVGGTTLGGGRGGPLGSIFGAYILMMRGQHSAGAERFSLLFDRRGGNYPGPRGAHRLLQPRFRSLAFSIRCGARFAIARASGRGILPRSARPATADTRDDRRIRPRAARRYPPSEASRRDAAIRGAGLSCVFSPSCWSRNLTLGHAIGNWNYYNSLVVLSLVPGRARIGPGLGDPDRRPRSFLPWTIGLCGILLAGMVKGSDGRLIYALPLVLAIGAFIGLVNGVGVALLGISPSS